MVVHLVGHPSCMGVLPPATSPNAGPGVFCAPKVSHAVQQRGCAVHAAGQQGMSPEPTPPTPARPIKRSSVRAGRSSSQQQQSTEAFKPPDAPMPPMLNTMQWLLAVSATPLPSLPAALSTSPGSAATVPLHEGLLNNTAARPPAPTEASLRAALRTLSATAPDTYQSLVRAAASLLRPAYPPLPPPYASLAGFKKLKPDSIDKQSPSSMVSSTHVTDLAQRLSSLLGTDAGTLLRSTFPNQHNSGNDTQGASAAAGMLGASSSVLAPNPAVADWLKAGAAAQGLGAHLDVSSNQLLAEDEQQVLVEMAAAGEADGGPPEGSIERVLWAQSIEAGQAVNLQPVCMTVPGWVDMPYATPAVPPRIPRDLYIKGRQLQPPTLRLPAVRFIPSAAVRGGGAARHPPCVGRVHWVLTQDDLQALPATTATSTPLIHQLVGWSGREPLDGYGPLLSVSSCDPDQLSDSNTRGSSSPETDASPARDQGGKVTGTSSRLNNSSSQGEQAAGQTAGNTRGDDLLPAAVRAAVHAIRVTLHNLCLDAVELHVYASMDLLDQQIGMAVVRSGVTSQDLLGHVLAHQSRVQRLIRRRRRDWRLLARAKAWRTAGRAYGAPQPRPSPTRAAAEQQDEIDAWADHLSYDPDCPSILVNVPEKDLIQAATTGRLPPRYKRFVLPSSQHTTRRPPVAAVTSTTGAPGKQAPGQETAAQQQQADTFESLVLAALDELKARLAMPWVDYPVVCQLQTVTLRQLLMSLGVVVHACGPDDVAQPGSRTGSLPASQVAARDIQALLRLTARHYPAPAQQQQQDAQQQQQDAQQDRPVNLIMAVIASDTGPVQAMAAAETKRIVSKVVISDNPNCQQLIKDAGGDACLSWQGLLSGSYLPGSGSGSGSVSK